MTLPENHPVHLLARHSSGPQVIACGTPVAHPAQYTDALKRVTCRRCAKYAPGLTEEQRIDVWHQANARLGRTGDSPWETRRAKAYRKQQREARRADRAAARALPCPRCGAAAGESCVSAKGNVLLDAHAVRLPAVDPRLPTDPASQPAASILSRSNVVDLASRRG